MFCVIKNVEGGSRSIPLHDIKFDIIVRRNYVFVEVMNQPLTGFKISDDNFNRMEKTQPEFDAVSSAIIITAARDYGGVICQEVVDRVLEEMFNVGTAAYEKSMMIANFLQRSHEMGITEPDTGKRLSYEEYIHKMIKEHPDMSNMEILMNWLQDSWDHSKVTGNVKPIITFPHEELVQCKRCKRFLDVEVNSEDALKVIREKEHTCSDCMEELVNGVLTNEERERKYPGDYCYRCGNRFYLKDLYVLHFGDRLLTKPGNVDPFHICAGCSPPKNINGEIAKMTPAIEYLDSLSET